MTNPFFTNSSPLISGQTARSGQLNATENAVQAGFDAVYTMLLQCFRTSGRTPGANDFAIGANAAACANRVMGFDPTGNFAAILNALLNPRGAWLTATAYAKNDIASQGPEQSLYVCLVGHTSGTFATDLAAGDWIKLLDNTAAYQSAFRGKIIVFSQSPYQAAAGDDLLIDVSGGPVAIALTPAPTIADAPIGITHLDGNISINNVTVGRNGKLIMGLAQDMLISSANASLMLAYSDDARGWRLVRGT